MFNTRNTMIKYMAYDNILQGIQVTYLYIKRKEIT
jgi:hypothetical protein